MGFSIRKQTSDSCSRGGIEPCKTPGDYVGTASVDTNGGKAYDREINLCFDHGVEFAQRHKLDI